MTHQQNKDEAPDKVDAAEFESRFAELIRRFWQLPGSPKSIGKDEPK